MIHSLLTVYDPLSTDRLWSTLYWPSMIHSLLTVYDPLYWPSMIHSAFCLYSPLSTDRLWSTLYWPSIIHSLLTVYNPLSADRLYSTLHSLLTVYNRLYTDRLWGLYDRGRPYVTVPSGAKHVIGYMQYISLLFKIQTSCCCDILIEFLLIEKVLFILTVWS